MEPEYGGMVGKSVLAGVGVGVGCGVASNFVVGVGSGGQSWQVAAAPPNQSSLASPKGNREDVDVSYAKM